MSERHSFARKVLAFASSIERKFKAATKQPTGVHYAKFLREQHEAEQATLTQAVIEASLGFDDIDEQLDHKTPMRRIF